MNEKIEFRPIGIIYSNFTKLHGMPIQPTGAKGKKGSIEIFPEYQAGLRDLDGFSHIILLYHLNRSEGYNMEVIPFLDTKKRGVFATRAPNRPNPIGLSVVELIGIEKAIVSIGNIDILDGTPLIDIKPYVPDFDTQKDIRTGWLNKVKKTAKNTKSDRRFM